MDAPVILAFSKGLFFLCGSVFVFDWMFAMIRRAL